MSAIFVNSIAFCVVLVLFLAEGAVGRGSQDSPATSQAQATTICKLVAQGKDYSEASVYVTARMTGTIEGTNLWDPACRNKGIDLWIAKSSRDQPEFQGLIRALRAHGTSDRPVIATFQGVFWRDWRDPTGRRRKNVLEAYRVSNIHQSAKVEER